MFGKARKRNIIFTILVISTLITNYYLIYKSHKKEIKEIQSNNIKTINKIKRENEKKFQDYKTETNSIILDRESVIMEQDWNIKKLNEYLGIKNKENNVIAEIENSPEFIVTAYDLSVQSCGKLFSDRSYGITANGTNLKGLNLRTASTISTDPNVIPLGSIVYLYFNGKKEYNGLYISNDTGSAIKGNKIDLFFGDYNSSKPSKLALNFGKQKAKVIFIE